ncbi:hypothetical protein ASD21_13845 [Caulobacter sp. Root1455]|nr:hypothetical protein ASD21_13845 [Caulobacter sp. Root1455]
MRVFLGEVCEESRDPRSGLAGLTWLTGLIFTAGFQHADQGGRQARGLSHATQRLAGVFAVGELGLPLKTLGFVQMIELAGHGEYLREMNEPIHVTAGRRTV